MVAARCTARPDLDRQRRQRAAAGVEAGAPIGVGVGLTLHRRCPTTRGGGGNSLRSTLLTRPMARHQWAYPLTCGAAHPPEATAPLPLPPLCPLAPPCRRASPPTPPVCTWSLLRISCCAELPCLACCALGWASLGWASRLERCTRCTHNTLPLHTLHSLRRTLHMHGLAGRVALRRPLGAARHRWSCGARCC